jgi:hypothetical protein
MEFDPRNFSMLTVAQPGIPYVKDISVAGQPRAVMLKVKLVDLRELEEYQRLAAHVRGYDERTKQKQQGFREFMPQLSSNRDGNGAFTMGLTVVNNNYIAPKAYLATSQAVSSGLLAWNQEFLALVGEVGAKAMKDTFQPPYLKLSAIRKHYVNTPCFGRDDKAQSFFNTVQINCSTVTNQVGGTAGGIHTDGVDCAASYFFSINCSVVRGSTDLGWFWFPNLDLIVPVRPGFGLIFQGIEEHTGTPLQVDTYDPSAIPCEYREETRFNIIAYLKKMMMDGSMQMNFKGEVVSGNPNCTVWEHAHACFGSMVAYHGWRERILVNLIRDTCRELYDTDELGITLDRQHLLNAIQYKMEEDDDVFFTSKSFADFESVRRRCLTRLHNIRTMVLATVSKPFSRMDREEESQELALEGVAGEAYCPSSEGNGSDSDSASESDASDSSSHRRKRARLDLSTASSCPSLLGNLQHDTQPLPSAVQHPAEVSLAAVEHSDLPPGPTGSATTSDMAVVQHASGVSVPGDIPAAVRPPSESSVIDIGRPSTAPASPSLLDCFLQSVDADELEIKTEELQQSPIREMNLNKGFRTLELLPRMDAIAGLTPADRIRTCMAYSHAFFLFQNKYQTANLLFQGFRANFLNLLIEFIEVMDDKSLNIWSDPTTILPHGSLALALHKAIDAQFDTWDQERINGITPHSDLRINAREMLGADFDETVHVNVQLSPRTDIRNQPNRSTESKGKILEDVIYGLCFHRPVNQFLRSLGSRQRKVTGYMNQVPGGKNRSKNLILSRTKLLRALQSFVCGTTDQASFWGFTMIPEILGFAFTHESAERVKDDSIQRLLDGLSSPFHLRLLESIRTHAQAYARHMSSLGSFPNRGGRGLPTHEFRALPAIEPTYSQRTAMTSGRKRKTATSIEGNPAATAEGTRLRASLDFAPSPAILDATNLSGFDRLLFEYLGHSLEVGRTILERSRKQDKLLKQWSRSQRASMQLPTFSDPLLALHIEKSASVWCPGDKYIIFRRHGPSMRLIGRTYAFDQNVRLLDSGDRIIFLWRLFLWRMYAFGKESRIVKVAQLKDLDGWRDMCSKKKKVKGNVMAYPQFRITPPEKQLDVFTKVWRSLPLLLRILSTDPIPSFAAVRDAVAALQIPYTPLHGLVTWLLVCDLSEFGFCHPPTSQDLAEKIGVPTVDNTSGGSGGAGPGTAFAVIAKERDTEIPLSSIEQVGEMLERVGKAFVEAYGHEWTNIMGRSFNMADMEHALCKITREWKGQGRQ